MRLAVGTSASASVCANVQKEVGMRISTFAPVHQKLTAAIDCGFNPPAKHALAAWFWWDGGVAMVD